MSDKGGEETPHHHPFACPTFGSARAIGILSCVNDSKKNCRHCHAAPGNWRKDLCRPCWAIPEIRQQYKSIRRSGRRGSGPAPGCSLRMPDAPTTCLPGTEAKIAMFAGRAERGMFLFHPRDRRLDQDGERSPGNPLASMLAGLTDDC